MVVDSVFFVLSAGFTTVVLVSVFFSVVGLTVVVFCSHAPNSAALAKIQINFFIIVWLRFLRIKTESQQRDFPDL